MSKRYIVVETSTFDDRIRVFRVRKTHQEPWQGCDVWVDPQSKVIARCTQCQSITVAMSACCPHAKAVSRWLSKHGLKP